MDQENSAETVAQAEQFSWLIQALEFGAIGLAALILIVPMMVMVFGSVEDNERKVMNRMMVVGAVCFVVAIGAELLVGLAIRVTVFAQRR